MPFTTKVFDLFYIRFPTGVIPGGYQGYLQEDWFRSSSLTGPIRMSSSFLNFPNEVSGSTYLTTRDSASLDNKIHAAIPWGSHASDFLWNVRTFSWSYTDAEAVSDEPPAYPPNLVRYWSASPVTKSFSREYQTSGSSFGVGNYSITSSWIVSDTKYPNIEIGGADFHHLHEINSSSAYPTYMYSLPNSTGTTSQANAWKKVGYSLIYPALTPESTSSIDGQYFDQAGGAMISRASVSRSLVVASISSSNNTATGLKDMTEALKARRLFFPTPYSGSGTPGGTDYWFKKYTGYRADEIFNENGGIYNVQLSLKRRTIVGTGLTTNYSPSTGSFMTVFIHNVVPQIPSSSQRIPGADGWYPPDNNIIKIGHGYDGGPELSFFDIQTGYVIEKFNFNVVQYGYPAQFCIEVSGSLADRAYFGIIVDDVQICKVGVTTDPAFIKPITVATSTRTRGGEGPPIDLGSPEEEPIIE